MKHRTYAQVKRSRPKEGWANVPDDSDHMLFARADSIARLCAFNPKSVYDWAIKEDNDLKDVLKGLTPPVLDKPMFPALFDAVILGLPFCPPAPSLPNVEHVHPLPAWAEGYYRVRFHTMIKCRKHSGW